MRLTSMPATRPCTVNITEQSLAPAEQRLSSLATITSEGSRGRVGESELSI